MKTFRLSFLLVLLVIVTSFQSNPEELFEGEMLLKECFVDIPLTYTKANEKKVDAKAKELEGQELILLNFNKKTKRVSYKRYYLISEKGENDKKIFNYLVLPEYYEAYKKGEIHAIFLKFRPKYDRFYISKCFDSVMSQNKELLSRWNTN